MNLLLLEFRKTASAQLISARGLPRVVQQILLAKHTLQCWVETYASVIGSFKIEYSSSFARGGDSDITRLRLIRYIYLVPGIHPR